MEDDAGATNAPPLDTKRDWRDDGLCLWYCFLHLARGIVV
jgi:hypothetical protein